MQNLQKVLMITAVSLSLLLGCACVSTGVSPLAISTLDEPHAGRYVGGGMPYGQRRRQHEGTWGREYVGCNLLHINNLRWGHATNRTQGGMGSY